MKLVNYAQILTIMYEYLEGKLLMVIFSKIPISPKDEKNEILIKIKQ